MIHHPSYFKNEAARMVIVLCLQKVALLPDWTCNFERNCLEDALDALESGNVEKAISALGQGSDHAWRDDYTEDRPEAYACKEAFDILTDKMHGYGEFGPDEDDEGSAA